MSSQHIPFTKVAGVVLVTLAYTDQFSYPQTMEEIYQRSAVPSNTAFNKKITKQVVQTAIAELLRKSLIEKVTDQQTRTSYFCLPGRSHTLKTRLERQIHALKKKHELKTISSFLQKVPWIVEVYLTGSQAMESADEESDIDFMIVTTPKRLWLSRILVSIFAQLQGKRRSWNHEEPGSWCFNLWLDTQHLAIDTPRQDVYRAYEVFQAKLLWVKSNKQPIFKAQNQWVSSFLVNSPVSHLPETSSLKPFLANNILLDFLDYVAWKFQSWYMKTHRTTERVGRGFAFFHPRDTGRMISESWQKSLQRCLPKSQAIEILQPYVRTVTS